MRIGHLAAYSVLVPAALMAGQILHAQERQREGQQNRHQEGGMTRENQYHNHGRISEERYHAHFGNEHGFRVKKRDYRHRRFEYGGYNWTFVEAWPFGWNYNDNLYVDYDDGGYWLYNSNRDGARISINIL